MYQHKKIAGLPKTEGFFFFPAVIRKFSYRWNFSMKKIETD